MDEGYIPDPQAVLKEYEKMVNAFNATGKAKVFEANFPNVNDLEVIRRIQESQEYVKKHLGYNL
jgi:hypothetical protein